MLPSTATCTPCPRLLATELNDAAHTVIVTPDAAIAAMVRDPSYPAFTGYPFAFTGFRRPPSLISLSSIGWRGPTQAKETTMNMDDIACITVLTAVALSISIATAGFVRDEVRRGAPVAQECPRSHATSMQVAPPPRRVL